MKSKNHAKAHEPLGKKMWNKSEMVLRAFGLTLLSNLNPRTWFRKHAQESIKIVVCQSRTIALGRSLVHIVPTVAVLWLVYVNLATYYVGSFIYAQVFYQVMAKVLEVLIQASLATIVLAYVRHELMLGNGLPFGALFSGLQIGQISYLWSKEFWGSVGSRSVPYQRKLAFLPLVLLAFILAAGAGPSTAVLLVPRRDYWPAGSTDIWLNGTVEDIWPSQINGSLVPSDCSTLSILATAPGICPASEWQAISTYLRIFSEAVPRSIPVVGDELGTFPQAAEVTGNSASRQLALAVALAGDPLGNATDSIQVSMSTTQQSVVADILVNAASIWAFALENARYPGHGVSPYDQQAAEHWIHANYYQPYSVANCVRDIIHDTNDTRPVSFPIIPMIGYDPIPSQYQHLAHYIDEVAVLDYPSTSRAQLLDIQGSPSNFRTTWIELSPSYFNVSSVGAIIVLPSQYTSLAQNSSQDFVVCNLGAGWGASSINVTYHEATTSATSSMVNSAAVRKSLDITKKKLSQTADADIVINWFQSTTDVSIAFGPPFFPNMMEIKREWAEYLDPQIPSLNSTLIDFMLKEQTRNRTIDYPEDLVQMTLAPMLANGLARIGYDYQFRGNPRLTNDSNGEAELDGTYWLSGKHDFFTVDQAESQNWVKLRMDSTIEGYAYNTHGVGPKVAIAFLLTYCTIAFAYTVYTGVTGKSSTAWDSISEVTALAMNSSRTKYLQNTCGGISELQTFQTLVRVMVRRDDDGEKSKGGDEEGEHLEMIFGDDGHHPGDGDETTIRVNRAYGAVPGMLFRE